MSNFSPNGTGTGTVPVAGNPVQLPPTSCRRVTISASDLNSDLLAIGDQHVSASGRRGVLLQPGFSETFFVASLNLLYIDAINSGDAFTYYWEIGS